MVSTVKSNLIHVVAWQEGDYHKSSEKNLIKLLRFSFSCIFFDGIGEAFETTIYIFLNGEDSVVVIVVSVLLLGPKVFEPTIGLFASIDSNMITE